MKTLAVDPGASGAFVWNDDEGIVHTEKIPDGMTAICDWVRDHLGKIDRAVVENVGGYRSGNSGPSSVKFARHVGNLEAALYMAGIPTVKVAPQTWMKALGTWPKDKAERKRAIKESMARLYPHLSVTLSNADALGILTWATINR